MRGFVRNRTVIVDDGGEASTVTGNKLDVNASFSPSGTQDVNVTQIGGASLTIGQQLAASSVPVILPAATITTLTPPAAITGYNLESTQLLVKAKTDNLDVLLSTRLSESDFDTKTGSLTESAPGTDTASSGLNGRLQRVAQRITSLITALGTPFQAGGSIGNTAFAVTKTALTANAAASVTCNAATTVLVALNASRKGLVITNTGSRAIFIGIGAAAVLNQGIYLVGSGGIWVMDDYTFTTQAINGITTSLTSNVSIQEFQ